MAESNADLAQNINQLEKHAKVGGFEILNKRHIPKLRMFRVSRQSMLMIFWDFLKIGVPLVLILKLVYELEKSRKVTVKFKAQLVSSERTRRDVCEEIKAFRSQLAHLQNSLDSSSSIPETKTEVTSTPSKKREGRSEKGGKSSNEDEMSSWQNIFLFSWKIFLLFVAYVSIEITTNALANTLQLESRDQWLMTVAIFLISFGVFTLLGGGIFKQSD